MTLAASAAAYAAAGVPVFPTRPRGKEPYGELVPRGFYDATTDTAVVATWWEREPNANIGIPMGQVSGRIAIDVDGPEGWKRLREIEGEIGALPPTLTVRTGRSEGAHLHFAILPGTHIPCRKLGSRKLEVKGDGGYVIGPGSIHPSGAVYKDDGAPLVVLPPVWVAYLGEPRSHLKVVPRQPSAPAGSDIERRAIAYLRKMPPAISGQGGHDATFKAAVVLVRGFALDPSTALRLLVEWYNPVCVPPWTDKELRHKVDSAAGSHLPEGYLLDASLGQKYVGQRLSQGHSLREIASDLGISKSSAHRMGGDSWDTSISVPADGTDSGTSPLENSWDTGTAGTDSGTSPLENSWDTSISVPAEDERLQLNAKDDEAVLCRRGWDHICAQDPNTQRLFRSGSRLVVVRHERGLPVMRELRTGGFRALAARVIAWVKYVQGREGIVPKPDHAKSSTITAMFDSPPEALPELVAISGVPVFAPDGRLIAKRGYDAAAALYYEPSCSVPDVPEQPADADTNRAQDLIFGALFRDFPFARESDRAHAFAALLNPFVRPMIIGPTPCFLFSSPQAGTGKTLLAELFETIAHGHSNVVPVPRNEDERLKLFASMLRKYPGRVMLLDNVPTGEINSGSLAAALTSSRLEARTLGLSETESPPNQATWFLTASNPTLTRELARRTVRIHLDSGLQAPEARRGFHIPNIRAWTLEHRGELAWAVLVLIRRWQALGARRSEKSLGSFEAWAGIVGGIVESIGLVGFLERGAENDMEADDPWLDVVMAWWDEHGERPVSVTDLMRLLDRHELTLPGMDEAITRRSKETRIGIALRGARDRVLSVGEQSWRVEMRGREAGRGRSLWRLRLVRGQDAVSHDSRTPHASTNEYAT